MLSYNNAIFDDCQVNSRANLLLLQEVVLIQAQTLAIKEPTRVQPTNHIARIHSMP